MGGMVLAMAIPQFDNVNSLVGNLAAAGSMLLPGLFFRLVQRKHRLSQNASTSRLLAMVFCWPMMVLGTIFLVLGMSSSMREIIEASAKAAGEPFGCGPWPP